MKARYLFISFVAGLGLTLALLWVLGGEAAPAEAAPNTNLALAVDEVLVDKEPAHRSQLMAGSVITVCLSGSCDYTTIQAAVDGANADDVIKVATGVYTDIHQCSTITQVVYISKSVIIQGGYTTTNWSTPYPLTQPTTLDAQGQGRGIYVTGDVDVTLEGLRITGGDAIGLGGYTTSWNATYNVGGGVYGETATLTVNECQIVTNTTTHYGGGLYLNNGNLTLADSTIAHNTPGWRGGGLYLSGSDVVLESNDVYSNSAQYYGGGVYLENGDALIRDNTITGNEVRSYDGGGLYLGGNLVNVSNNIISHNQAVNRGGGLYVGSSWAVLTGNTLSGNRTTSTGSSRGGGGLYMSGDGVVYSNIISGNTSNQDGGGLFLAYGDQLTLDNNLIVENRLSGSGNGAGVYVNNSTALFRHTTLARNTKAGGGGSGIHVYAPSFDESVVVMTNTILVSHTVGVYAEGVSTVTLEATLWGTGTWANTTSWTGTGIVFTGTKNLWEDPGFVNYAAGDYHITSSSQAVDEGIDVGVLDDVDGDPRPADLYYDIGADEWPGGVLRSLKIAQPGSFNPGQTITYTVLISSVGATNVPNVLFTDTLPLYQQPLLATSSQVTPCVVSSGWGGQVTCALGTVTAGSTARVTITAQATVTIPGPLPYAMQNIVQARGDNGATETLLTVYLHNCHVRVNGSPPDYTTVQPAIDAASNGDTVKVSGICAGVGARDGLRQSAYISETLTLRGGYDSSFATWNPVSYPAVIHATDNGRVAYITGAISPTLEWLHLTGGDASGLAGGFDGTDAGGAVYVDGATGTFSTCQVYENTAQRGAGFYFVQSSSTVTGCLFYSNTSKWHGGAMYFYLGDVTLLGNVVMSNTAPGVGGGVALNQSVAQVDGNTFSGNVGGSGGGLHMTTSPATVSNNTFLHNNAGMGGGIEALDSTVIISGNLVMSNTSSSSGAGIYMAWCTATLSANSIVSNTSGWFGGGVEAESSKVTGVGNTVIDNSAVNDGGGFLLTSSDITLVGNTILGNASGDKGGGMHFAYGAFTLTNNFLAQNTAVEGAALWMQGSGSSLGNGLLRHNTIADNGSGDAGIHVGITSTLDLQNNIIAGHNLGITVTAGSAITLEYTLWYSNTSGHWDGMGIVNSDNNVNGNPMFIGGGNYHITTTSAGRDAGVPVGVHSDIDGEYRPQGNGYDIGADELLAINIDGATGGTITYIGPQGLTVTVQALPGTVTDTVTLAFAPIPSSTLPISPGLQYSAIAFDLDAFCYTSHSIYLPLVLRNYSGSTARIVAGATSVSVVRCTTSPPPSSQNSVLCHPTLNKPVTITIQYRDSDIAGLVENNLRLYYWTGSYWRDAATTCITPSTYITDTVVNLLQVPICHLSQYSMR